MIIPSASILEIAVNNKKGQPTKTYKSVNVSRSLNRDDARRRFIRDTMKAKPCISTENKKILCLEVYEIVKYGGIGGGIYLRQRIF